MKNSRFSYQDVYGFIRDAYLDSFPYSSASTGEYIMQKAMLKLGVKGSFEEHKEEFRFLIQPSTSTDAEDESVFGNKPVKVKAELERFLHSPDNVKKLISDINKLQQWLVTHNYITNDDVASEKMLKEKSL